MLFCVRQYNMSVRRNPVSSPESVEGVCSIDMMLPGWCGCAVVCTQVARIVVDHWKRFARERMQALAAARHHRRSLLAAAMVAWGAQAQATRAKTRQAVVADTKRLVLMLARCLQVRCMAGLWCKASGALLWALVWTLEEVCCAARFTSRWGSTATALRLS